MYSVKMQRFKLQIKMKVITIITQYKTVAKIRCASIKGRTRNFLKSTKGATHVRIYTCRTTQSLPTLPSRLLRTSSHRRQYGLHVWHTYSPWQYIIALVSKNLKFILQIHASKPKKTRMLLPKKKIHVVLIISQNAYQHMIKFLQNTKNEK